MVETRLAAGVAYSRKFHAARAWTTLTIGGPPCADVICWPYLRGESTLRRQASASSAMAADALSIGALCAGRAVPPRRHLQTRRAPDRRRRAS